MLGRLREKRQKGAMSIFQVGVYVMQVDAGSLAETLGLQVGTGRYW